MKLSVAELKAIGRRLHDDDRQVRLIAAKLLPRCGKRCLPYLQEVLRGEDMELKLAALSRVNELGAQVAPLLHTLARNSQQEIQHAAIYQLLTLRKANWDETKQAFNYDSRFTVWLAMLHLKHRFLKEPDAVSTLLDAIAHIISRMEVLNEDLISGRIGPHSYRPYEATLIEALSLLRKLERYDAVRKAASMLKPLLSSDNPSLVETALACTKVLGVEGAELWPDVKRVIMSPPEYVDRCLLITALGNLCLVDDKAVKKQRNSYRSDPNRIDPAMLAEVHECLSTLLAQEDEKTRELALSQVERLDRLALGLSESLKPLLKDDKLRPRAMHTLRYLHALEIEQEESQPTTSEGHNNDK